MSTIVDNHLQLDRLREDVQAHCHKCKLRCPGVNVIFGEGDSATKMGIIGEGPGRNENAQVRPFVGEAGLELNKALVKVKVPRSRLWLDNIILCQPPGNRDPEPEEWEACRPRLDRVLQLVHPKVILALGTPAGKALVDPDFRITRHRGIWTSYKGIQVISTFHPAYFLYRKHEIQKLPNTPEGRKKAREIYEVLERDMKLFLEDLNAAVDKADLLDPSVPLRVLEEI